MDGILPSKSYMNGTIKGPPYRTPQPSEAHNFSGIASRTENMTMVTVVTPQDRPQGTQHEPEPPHLDLVALHQNYIHDCTIYKGRKKNLDT